MIQYLDLVGNKGTEEVIQVIETYLSRNRGEMGGLGKLLVGISAGAAHENEVPYAIL